MVTGLNVFRDYFADDTDKYVLIGGAACDIVFTSNTTSGKPQFFRFTEPKDPSYPKMIELFARTEFPLREPNVLTPIHIDDDIASLSGILLNEDYYSVLLKGRTVIDGLSVLRPEYLILFKAKAYMDLKAKRDAGEEVHSSEFKKHLSTILVIQANHLFQSILTLYFLNISSAFTLRYRLLFVLVTEILIYRQHCNQTGSISFRYFPEILILLSPF